MVTDHRQAAIEAIAGVLGHPPRGRRMTLAEWDRARAEAAFEAALPHMLRLHADHDREVRAVQREADAQLAEDIGAVYEHLGEYTGGPHSIRPFADLLRNPPEGTS